MKTAEQKTKNREVTKAYQRTKHGLCVQIYGTQVARSKRKGFRRPEYTREELEDWLMSQKLFHELYSEWVNSGYDKDLKPSVDRICDNVHYCMSNIQLMAWAENNEKGRISKFKPVIGVNKKTGEVVEFSSIKKAEKVLGITGISNNLIGKAPSAGDFKWKYKG